MSESAKIPVAVLGATGMVGQRFIALLDGHPRFRVVAVYASARSAGQCFEDACRWSLPSDMPESARGLVVGDASAAPITGPGAARLAFSALDASVAKGIEAAYAHSGCLVVSNASAFRMDPEVPLVIPEVNGDHLEMLRHQRFGSGGIVCNPNCSTIGLVMALAPLHRVFGVEAVAVTTLQAASGGGYPGVSALDLIDNVVPLIRGEEEKLVEEPAKILGTLGASGGQGPMELLPAALTVSPQCFRVAVVDGHSASVAVRLGGSPGVDQVLSVWRDASRTVPLRYTSTADRPQPRLDRDLEGGMGITIGRLRECPVMGLRFVTLSHNTVRGAAGGAIATAEAALERGFVPS